MSARQFVRSQMRIHVIHIAITLLMTATPLSVKLLEIVWILITLVIVAHLHTYVVTFNKLNGENKNNTAF